jgi:outer membrane protein OmpA-like peptidoglycan-associated protein
MGQKEGFFNVSEEFRTSKTDVSKKLSLSLVIEEIIPSDSGTGSGIADDGSSTAPKTYNIGEVFYDYNEASLRPDGKPVLDKLVTLLLDNPKLSIEIHSHCDSRGGDAYNLALSKRRAESVLNYLIENGISNTRLRSKGFGSSQPVNRCRTGVQCSEEEHQANRRTEFIVLATKNM